MTGQPRYAFWLGAGTAGPGEPAPGIRRLELSRDGQPSLGPFLAAGDNPTFVATLPGDLLSAVNETAAGQISLVSPVSQSAVSSAPTLAADPCHVCVHVAGGSTTLFVANYSGGTLTVHPVSDAQVGEPTLSVLYGDGSVSPHPHQAVIDRDRGLLYVPDLGLDAVHIHRLADLLSGNPEYRDLELPAGTGPRHLVVDGDVILVVGELSRTITAVDLATGAVLAASPSTANPGDADEPGPSALRLTRFGHIVVANRGPNTLAVLSWDAPKRRLALLGETHCGGVHPRDLEFTDDERYLVVAHQWSDHLTVFELDPVSGALSRVGGIDTPSPECVARI